MIGRRTARVTCAHMSLVTPPVEMNPDSTSKFMNGIRELIDDPMSDLQRVTLKVRSQTVVGRFLFRR